MTATDNSWIEKSNANAFALAAVWAKYEPEQAAATGVPGLDENIFIPHPDRPERIARDLGRVREELQRRLAAEPDARVRRDIEIIIAAADRAVRSMNAKERVLLPYENVAGRVFFGLQILLNDQVPVGRRKAALVRLRRYAGLEEGYRPLTELCIANLKAKLGDPGLAGPARVELEKDLENTATYVRGIGGLLESYRLTGYEQAYAALSEQLAEYDSFLRKEILKRARVDFRLPKGLYEIALEEYGVDYPAGQLNSMAHRQYEELQRQMQQVASRVAKERHLPGNDYRDVIRELKKQQLSQAEILPHYRRRLEEIEAIIRREGLLTLPARPAIIRLATEAETAQQPAPHMVPPTLIGNRGEQGQFVLPLETSSGGQRLKYDDFTFAAASWTLTAHEARPGHELQFASMVERGVSMARAVMAYNSATVEGWGLYAESIMLPYMPDDAKLISLQLRLHRAARAFLDPELQQGKITPARAKEIMEHDVVLSEAFAREEVERFTFRLPGQAVSYFAGYNRLLEIRAAAEAALGADFHLRDFHDFVLSQGLLPPGLLKEAVTSELVFGYTRSRDRRSSAGGGASGGCCGIRHF